MLSAQVSRLHRHTVHRIAILAIILGVAVGIAGGVFAIEAWIDVGEGVAMAGIVALYCLAIGKKPIETLKAQAEVETLAAGVSTRVHRIAAVLVCSGCGADWPDLDRA